MELFLIYALFALTTAFSAHYELVWPVICKQEYDSKKQVPNKYLLSFTFMIINTLAAPFVFFSCIIPSWGMRFRESLQTAVFHEDQEI